MLQNLSPSSCQLKEIKSAMQEGGEKIDTHGSLHNRDISHGDWFNLRREAEYLLFHIFINMERVGTSQWGNVSSVMLLS
jgi:hypothetical protein